MPENEVPQLQSTDENNARLTEGVDPDEVKEPLTESESSADEAEEITNTIESPAKVLRIGSMIKQLLDEVKAAPVDEPSRERMADIFEISVRQLAEGLSPDLREELDQLVLPFESEAPSEAELRIAHAQLVGWLEGLFHGIQATLMAQQVQARGQLEQMRRGLPQGQPGYIPGSDAPQHNGNYL